MSSCPGRIKAMVDIPEELQSLGKDRRVAPAFGQIRQTIWDLLRDEVLAAQEDERRRKLARHTDR